MVQTLVVSPILFKDIRFDGWYFHIDPENQRQRDMFGGKPYGGWFYQRFEGVWRTTTGCADCGPFENDDWFIGPVALDDIPK